MIILENINNYEVKIKIPTSMSSKDNTENHIPYLYFYVSISIYTNIKIIVNILFLAFLFRSHLHVLNIL